MIVASTKRASRAARSPPPSEEAQERAWRAAAQAAGALEADGLTRLLKAPPVTYVPKAASGRTGQRDERRKGEEAGPRVKSEAGTSSDKLSHLFSLQRPIDANAREASFLSYEPQLPLEAAHLAAGGMRSTSVRASLVEKPKKTMGGGQQTTRNNLGDLSAAHAAQTTAVAAALGAAAAICAARGVPVSNPAATTARPTAELVAVGAPRLDEAEALFVTSSARLLPHALPTRLCSHNLLDSMRAFAQSELEMGTIRSVVPQQIDSLKAVCNAIIDRTDGVSIWAAWVLLVHMLSDPRTRRMIASSRILDMEAATANLFQNYARAEVTRRARMDTPKQGPPKKKKKKKPAANPQADDDEGSDDNPTDDENASEEEEDGPANAGGPDTVSGDLDALMRAIKITARGGEAKGGVKEEEREAVVDPLLSPASTASTASVMSSTSDPVTVRLEADKHTLSQKRKRPPSSSVAQVSGGFLDYWAAALSSEYANILRLMITQSEDLANSAAVETLSGQMPRNFHAARNALLVDISSRNAVQSAMALSSLVLTKPDRVPQVVAWRARGPKGTGKTCHVGLVRSRSDASHTSVHACVPAPSSCQALGGARNDHVCLWSLAVRNNTPTDATTSVLPGIVECEAHGLAVARNDLKYPSRYHRARVLEAIEQRRKRAASDGTLDIGLTGVARGVVVLRARLVVGDSQVRAGEQIASRMTEIHEGAQREARGVPMGDYESCALLSNEPLDGVAEPYATPCNNLGLATEVTELVRVLLKNKCNKGDPCRHTTGMTAANETQDYAVEEQDKPQTLLPIVDYKVDFLEDPTAPGAGEALPGRRDARLHPVAITLTVCGDCPVRLGELLDALCADAAVRKDDPVDATLRVFEVVALALGGAARASELNDVANSVSAGHVNASIASAKRILVGDLNLRLLLTLYQVYRVGTSNVPRSFETTPWSGTYGAGFDIGTSAGIGIRASSITADRRNHGKLLMSGEQVDGWSDACAARHYVPVSDTHYAAIPRECRGVPHYTSPGVHAYLDHYEAGLERARSVLGIAERRTVDSLQALPFGPYAERQAPHVAEQSDPTLPKRFRNPDDSVGAEGVAFQVDATSPDVAVLREPLIARAAITSPQDCIFGQSAPFVTSAVGAAALLARTARTAYLLAHPDRAGRSDPKAEIALLHALIDAYVTSTTAPPEGCSHYHGAVALVLLNAIFTSRKGMAELALLDGVARGPALCAQRIRAQLAEGKPIVGAPAHALLRDVDEIMQVQGFWAPFARASPQTNAWLHLEPLLLEFATTGGSYDNDLAALDRMAGAITRMVTQATWFSESPDGAKAPRAPSPLAGVRGFTQVRAEHVTPVFVGTTDALGQAVPARASLVGLAPMQWQQVLALLTGAAADPTVVVNVAHNFSFLSLRPSAAPDILTTKGRQRSAKAVSCCGVDGDEPAYGTREAKLAVCALHRAAWKTNLDLVKPLCLRVARPRPEKARARGDRGCVDYVKTRKRELDAQGMVTRQEAEAAGAFNAAHEATRRRAARPV